MGIEQSKEILKGAAKSIAEERPRHRSVLLVESDPDLQWHLARMLTVDGNRVVGTSSADGAFTIAREWQADLAIIATQLPGVSGLEVAKSLRADNPDLIVILTGEQTSASAPKPTSSEVAAFLPKPFRFEALRSLIESLQLTPAPAE